MKEEFTIMKFGIHIRVIQKKNDTSYSKEEQYNFFERRNIRVRIFHMKKDTSIGLNTGFDTSTNTGLSPKRDTS